MKVHAGAPILELGLEEHDFAEMAAGGVTLVGEIGLGSVKTGAQAAPMVAWAKQHGMTVTFHTGGPSIAGSNPIAADAVLEARPHIVGHVNGGTTPMSDARHRAGHRHGHGDRDRPLRQRRAAIHAVRTRRASAGRRSPASARDHRQRRAVRHRASSRSGSCGSMAHLASLGGVAPEIAVAMATGNTARVHGLDVGRARARAARRTSSSCDAPDRVVGVDRARGARASATCRASRWC